MTDNAVTTGERAMFLWGFDAGLVTALLLAVVLR